jgi:hypothetical protein
MRRTTHHAVIPAKAGIHFDLRAFRDVPQNGFRLSPE